MSAKLASNSSLHSSVTSIHDYIGHNYIGHNYIGHNYIGHNYIACIQFVAILLGDIEPYISWPQYIDHNDTGDLEPYISNGTFQADEYIESRPAEHRDFYSRFARSLAFSKYVESLMQLWPI